MAGNILEISDATFEEEVLKADVPVMLDFGAEWCGPCKMIKPLLSELSESYMGKARIAYIDVDDNPNTAAKFRVHGIPTVIVFKNGEEVERCTGANSKEKYAEMLDHALR